MIKETIFLRGKPVYVTFDDQSEKDDFDNVRFQDGVGTAYQVWLGWKKKKKARAVPNTAQTAPKIVPKKSPQPFLPFESRISRALDGIEDGRYLETEGVLTEEPHLFFYPRLKEPMRLPGTNVDFQYGIDFRLERWAGSEAYKTINLALLVDGVVGRTKTGVWIFFKLPRKMTENPTIREATPEEAARLPQLPDGWEDKMAVDASGEKYPSEVGR